MIKLIKNLNELLDKEKKDNKEKINIIKNCQKEIDNLKKEKENNNILGLKIVVNKFADEKISINEKKKNSLSSINIHNFNNINNRYNDYGYDKEDEKRINNAQNIKTI